MNLAHFLTIASVFFRFAIGFVFLISSGSKVRDIAQFQRSVAAFRLLSRKLSHIAAICFLGGELAVVLCLLVGGSFELLGFGLALLLLLSFTVAIFFALIRKMHLTCNCFGASQQPLASVDVWRNIGLIVGTLCGYSTSFWVQQMDQQSINIGEWLLAGASALLLSLLWLHLKEIVQLLEAFRWSHPQHL